MSPRMTPRPTSTSLQKCFKMSSISYSRYSPRFVNFLECLKRVLQYCFYKVSNMLNRSLTRLLQQGFSTSLQKEFEHN